MATRSPTLTFFTEEPTSTTVPELSWPSTIGDSRIKSIQTRLVEPDSSGSRLCTSNPPSLPVVYVTSTNTSLRNVYSYIPRVIQDRNWAVLKNHILNGTQDERSVCFHRLVQYQIHSLASRTDALTAIVSERKLNIVLIYDSNSI